MKIALNVLRALIVTVVLTSVLAYASGPPPTPEPPANVTSRSRIAPEGEPGQALQISGQVFAPDGQTPVGGVIVYAYQTDSSGEYHNDRVTRIARLHGWAKTDSQGHFEFRTIRPGAYPGRNVAAHVHFHVWGSGYPLQWTPELLFGNDPLLQPAAVEESRRAGKFGNVCAVARDAQGAQVCAIRFRLLKETNYAPADRTDPRTHSKLAR